MSKQKTGRTHSLWTRVIKENKAFVQDVAKNNKKSAAILVDTLLTHARRNMSRTQIKELLNAKSGNAVSSKVSKKTQASA